MATSPQNGKNDGNEAIGMLLAGGCAMFVFAVALMILVRILIITAATIIGIAVVGIILASLIWVFWRIRAGCIAVGARKRNLEYLELLRGGVFTAEELVNQPDYMIASPEFGTGEYSMTDQEGLNSDPLDGEFEQYDEDERAQ